MENYHVLDKKLSKQVRHFRLMDIPEYYALMDDSRKLSGQAAVIEFHLRKRSTVNLKVQDHRGEDIATLISAPLKKGKYRVTWDSDNLPPGEYNFRLKVGKFFETKKFRLLK
jgi:hypothetical protein